MPVGTWQTRAPTTSVLPLRGVRPGPPLAPLPEGRFSLSLARRGSKAVAPVANDLQPATGDSQCLTPFFSRMLIFLWN